MAVAMRLRAAMNEERILEEDIVPKGLYKERDDIRSRNIKKIPSRYRTKINVPKMYKKNGRIDKECRRIYRRE